jgi:hypothetical protein
MLALDNPKPAPANERMRYTQPYHDAVAFQRLIKSKAADPNVTPAALSALARAWDVLEERKRIFRMKPKPKPLDTTRHDQPSRRKNEHAADFTEEKESLKPTQPSPPPEPGEGVDESASGIITPV